MRINQNIAAFNSYRNLSMTNTVMGKSLEKLSSGFRINRAADDAAGLVISQGLRAQVSGLRQATRNAQDGISVVQTAEGALNEVHAMLERMRTLAVQASNGSNDEKARAAAQAEITELSSEIDRISTTTRFGNIALLSAGAGGAEEGTAGTATVTPTGTDWGFTTAGDDMTFKIAVDGGTAVDITVSGNHANLDSLQGAIQTALDAADVEVDVTVEGSNLVFTSRSTGSDSSVTITDVTNDLGALDGLVEVEGTGEAGPAPATAAAASFTLAGTDFEYDGAGNEFSFDVAVDGGEAQTVTLDEDYTDADAFLAAINGQLDGATAAIEDGELTITSDSTGAGSSLAISNLQGNAGDSAIVATEVTGTDAEGGTIDFQFQVGANSGDTISFEISTISADILGIANLDVESFQGAQDAIDALDTAIEDVSTTRGKLGAVQNRFESTINNLQVTTENLAASESRIRDTDMALEMVSFTRHQILLQAGTAMLGQANMLPQSVLRLLG